MPKTLIVPMDGSGAAERAVPVAQRIAARLDACDLVLVSADVRDGERTRSYIEALAARTDIAGGSVRAECVTGDATGAITRLTHGEPDAAVCMATHGRGRLAEPLLGSVATEVLRNVRVPVLLVGPHCEHEWWHEPPHLVACWAGADSDAVLTPARSWSDALGMDLSLLCVFHPLDVAAIIDPRAQFEPALAQFEPGNAVSTVALHDDFPAAAIADRAAALPATLLAVTTRARTSLGRAVLGSVALDVVHRSPCPVLVVGRS